MKFNLESLLIKLICIFPITVLIQRYSKIPNRILFSIIIILLFISFILAILKLNTYKRLMFLVMAIVLLGVVSYDYIFTAEKLINFNDILYLPFWFLFISYLILRDEKYSELLEKNLKLIRYVTILCNFLILFFFLLERSYFYNGRHRMASGLFLLICEIYYYVAITKKRKIVLLGIVPCLGILNSTSRTYVVMLLLVLMIAFYKECRKKSTFYLSIIPLSVICFIFIVNSDIWNYFTYKQVGNFDFWGSVTSGRTIFWEKDIQVYIDSKAINKLFGSGYNLVYYVNKSAIDAYIYAHNDFINIIIANGIVGLFIYLLPFVKLIQMNIKKKKYGFYITSVIVCIFLFNAMLNGQYNYPAAVFSILFLFSAFGEKRIKKC